MNGRQLQLEAQTLRRSQDLEQQSARIAHEREVELRELQKQQAAAQPQLLKRQSKQQMSQQATYKAKIYVLNTEIVNMKEKSELQYVISTRTCRIESPTLSMRRQKMCSIQRVQNARLHGFHRHR